MFIRLHGIVFSFVWLTKNVHTLHAYILKKATFSVTKFKKKLLYYLYKTYLQTFFWQLYFEC